MDDGYRWVTIPGRGPVKIKTTNEYMNDLIRGQAKLVKNLENEPSNEDNFSKYEEGKERFQELFNKDATTARTEFYKEHGFDRKPIVMNETEFNNIVDDKNPIMQRATSQKGYDDLIGGEYRTSDLVNSMYGTGIYFAYGEDDKEYYAKLANTQIVFEGRMDKSAKMLNNKQLDKIKDEIKTKLGNDRKKIDSIVLADNGVLAASLGYDGIYFDNVKYGLVLNRGKLIIKK